MNNPQRAQWQEWTQPFLVVLSFAFACLMPLDGFFLVYLILGPLHYLTQLNWLHDRDYFIEDRARRFVFIGIVTVGISLDLFVSHKLFFAPYIAAALVLAVLMVMQSSQKWSAVALLTAGLFIGFLLTRSLLISFLIGTLLLTIAHVAVFTLCFVLNGARKRQDVTGKLTVILWVIAAIALFIIPTGMTLLWPEKLEIVKTYFRTTLKTLGADVSLDQADESWAKALSFMAFAYSYHYLNWFSKTEILKWHDIPRSRMIGIALLYIGLVALYFYDFMSGWVTAVFLANLHVVAEFPLDAIAVRNLLSRQPKNL